MANGKLQPFTKIEKPAVGQPPQIIGITASINPPPKVAALYPLDRERWENSEYAVFLDRNHPHGFGTHITVWHLAIRRKDQEPATDWRDLQAIKNDLVGHEYEALDLFPAESRVIDVANETHLYALLMHKTPVRIPVGRTGPREVNDVLAGQRPL